MASAKPFIFLLLFTNKIKETQINYFCTYLLTLVFFYVSGNFKEKMLFTNLILKDTLLLYCYYSMHFFPH